MHSQTVYPKYMNVDNGTSCSEPPLLSTFFSRILLEGFNREQQWRTWGRGSPGQRPPARGLGATLHSVSAGGGWDGGRQKALVLRLPGLPSPSASTVLLNS